MVELGVAISSYKNVFCPPYVDDVLCVMVDSKSPTELPNHFSTTRKIVQFTVKMGFIRTVWASDASQLLIQQKKFF